MIKKTIRIAMDHDNMIFDIKLYLFLCKSYFWILPKSRNLTKSIGYKNIHLYMGKNGSRLILRKRSRIFLSLKLIWHIVCYRVFIIFVLLKKHLKIRTLITKVCCRLDLVILKI